MQATIALKLADKTGTPTEREATFDGDRWTSDDEFAANLLNAYAGNWRLRDYHPSPIIGTAMEVVASLPSELEARFLNADAIDYSNDPADALY